MGRGHVRDVHVTAITLVQKCVAVMQGFKIIMYINGENPPTQSDYISGNGRRSYREPDGGEMGWGGGHVR